MCTFIFGVKIMKESYMKIALNEAKKSFNKNEVPVGCIIVKNNKIIAKTHNLKEKHKSVLYHAELLAIKKASKKLKNWRLNGCELYVTLQPCPMCSSAIKQARISKIYYGVDNKNNEISNKILVEKDINSNVNIEEKVCESECKKIIVDFFKNKRK